MSEGTPERPARAQLPHLIVPWDGSDRPYRGRAGGQPKKLHSIPDRGGHSARLAAELEAAQQRARDLQAAVDPAVRADGFPLAVDAWSDEPGYQLALDSLNTRGARLLSVLPATGQAGERAVVWLPYGAVGNFFRRLEEFADQQTSKGLPKQQNLVANIAELRLAVMRDLWQEPDAFPDPEEPRWWEVWLARLDARLAPDAVLRAVAGELGWQMADDSLIFPDNVVTLVRTSATELGTILSTSAIPSELHKARVASEILDLDVYFQRDLIADLAERIESARPGSTAVCLLDTGLMTAHPLLQASVDSAESALAGIGPADAAGHGTQMAGLALFSDLDRDLKSSEPVPLRHRLESVKVIRGNFDAETPPQMYGTVSAGATARVEITAPARRRVFSMAVTADDPEGIDGRPTSWSAALDSLACGTDIRAADSGIELLTRPDPRSARLYVVSAGNITPDPGIITDQLAVCDTTKIQNPAQAWNVLTVGAYTQLTEPPADTMFAGWAAIAPAGELSPFSRTSVACGRSWPIKPDVVLEGGNLITDGRLLDQHADVSLLTTSNKPHALLTSANATSAATAQASRLAAIAIETYPSLWPEAIRGLVVHAAEWTPAMTSNLRLAGSSKTQRVSLIRRYGWGVPTQERVMASASRDVTLIVQDEFLPFEVGKNGISMRAFRLHELPWPQEQLRELFGATVRMRVTLSYYVEPNPSSRGWQGRYRYASHGLRFDVKRPTETIDDFQRRLSNQAAQEETGSAPRTADSDDRWFIGSRTRNAGSLHADFWTGTGAALADSGYIGVTPVGGWWKDNNRRDRIGLPVRYALLVSLRTDAMATDIYTPIATQIGLPVQIVT